MNFAEYVRSGMAVAVALTMMGTGRPAAAEDSVIQFSSPSGGIGCVWSDFDRREALRCDVVGGVVPLPPRPASCTTEVDYGQGYEMGATGRAVVVCAGDTARGSPNVVAYGTTWRHRSFRCASSRDGMRCTNRSGHGFLVSRGDSRRF